MPKHEGLDVTQKKNSISNSNQSKKMQLMRDSNSGDIIQRARMNPQSLAYQDIMQLQKTIGNQAVCQLMSEIRSVGENSKSVQQEEIKNEQNDLTDSFGQVIQRRVSQIRSGESKGKWKSSLILGEVFDTEEEAEEAEQLKLVEMEEEAKVKEAVRRERLTSAPTIVKQNDLGAIANTNLSLRMAQHPAHFGPLMTRGGHITTAQVAAAAGKKVAPARGPEDLYDHSGTNTNAAIFSSLSVADIPVSTSIYSGTGDRVSMEELEDKYPPETRAKEFRDGFTFQQGPPPKGVTLPERRKTAHAEINGLYSEGMKSAIRNGSQEVDYLMKALGGLPENLTGEQTDEDIEKIAMAIGVNPVATAALAENRSTCGILGESGYPGGCTAELADRMKDVVTTTHENAVGVDRAFFQTAMGFFSPTVSTAGMYGKQGDPKKLVDAGWSLGVHNTYDFAKGKGLKPLDSEQLSLKAHYDKLQEGQYEDEELSGNEMDEFEDEELSGDEMDESGARVGK